jgi:hypothetical protein
MNKVKMIEQVIRECVYWDVIDGLQGVSEAAIKIKALLQDD